MEPSGDDCENFGTSWGVVVCILFSLKQVAENIKRTGNKHICGVVSGPVSEPRRPCERLFHERAFRSLAKTGGEGSGERGAGEQPREVGGFMI